MAWHLSGLSEFQNSDPLRGVVNTVTFPMVFDVEMGYPRLFLKTELIA